LGTKKIVHSLVVVQLDENEKVLKFEDRWDAKELPSGNSVSPNASFTFGRDG